MYNNYFHYYSNIKNNNNNNTVLNETHFETHHKYKLEWQPGSNGYLYWYLDDRIIFGIDGDEVFKINGAMIPMVSCCYCCYCYYLCFVYINFCFCSCHC